MRYMMMVKGDADYEAGKPPSPEMMAAVAELAERHMKQGILVEQGGLLPSAAGALVRVRDGKVTVLDGPFAEAREVVGGYAIIEADSRAEAIRLGREFMELHLRVMGSSYQGELEIRQLSDQAPCADP